MRKSYLILNLFLITSLIISCSNDDDNSNELLEINDANLIGKWQLTAYTENGNSITLDQCESNNINEYFADNTVEITYSYENGSTPVACTEVSYMSLWELNGNIITYEAGDSPETILELTETTLKIKYTDNEEGITYTYIDTYTKVQ